MTRDLLLGIDIGTTACKVGVFTSQGKALAVKTAEYPTDRPHDGWAQQNPEDWWKAVKRCLSSVRSDGLDLQRIAGVGVSNMSTTMLPVDRRGRPVRPAIIWPDTRPVEECEWLKTHVGQDAFSAVSHNVIGTFCSLPKMVWFKNHEPDLYERTAAFLQAGGYIVLKLTGRFSVNLSDIEMTGLGDARAGNWSADMAEQTGISPEKLAPVKKCFEVVGEVTGDVAHDLGLTQGIPVVAGSTDIAAAALVAGVTKPGQAFIDAGHATNLAVCIDQPLYHKGLIFFGSVDPGMWLIEGASGYTGASMRWLRNLLFEIDSEMVADDTSLYTVMDSAAEKSSPGAGGTLFLPYLNGALCPLWDTKARGMFFGLSLGTKKEDLIRSVMEGCAFDLYFNLEIIESLGGDVSELVITGGGSRSRPWNQARADIMQKPLKTASDSSGSVQGAALLGGVGAGIFRNTREATDHLEHTNELYTPRTELMETYQQLYRVYRALYRQTRDQAETLYELAAQQPGC